MRDEIETEQKPALLLRPVPSTLADGNEPIRFGGKPRLPQALEWPANARGAAYHFVAEIDLAVLRQSAHGFNFPDMPDYGVVFIFLPLDGDGIYQQDAVVLYTPENVTELPERTAPTALPNLLVDRYAHVHPDGTTDDGRLLVRQAAEVVPFLSERAINPLALNMIEAAGGDVSPWKRANKTQQLTLEEACRRTWDYPDPRALSSNEQEIIARIPNDIGKFQVRSDSRYLDWEFIFDWSKKFMIQSCRLTLGHFTEMYQAGYRHPMLGFMRKRCQNKHMAAKNRQFGKGRKPWFWTFDDPVPVTETIDWQARRWMALSQFQSGKPSEQMLSAFVDMLLEIYRHYEKTDADGYNLGPRIGMLDHAVKGHDKHAGNTLVNARQAFRLARQRAQARAQAEFEATPQVERWDRRVVEASEVSNDPNYSLGIMPLQMFGLGFEIQSAVTDHADDVLLFQVGDSFGLPLEFGPDGIVQLWIDPKDLSQGRFDRVQLTYDMT